MKTTFIYYENRNKKYLEFGGELDLNGVVKGKVNKELKWRLQGWRAENGEGV